MPGHGVVRRAVGEVAPAPTHHGFLAGTASEFALRKGVLRARRKAALVDGVETPRTQCPGRLAAVIQLALANSSGLQKICLLQKGQVPASVELLPGPLRGR